MALKDMKSDLSKFRMPKKELLENKIENKIEDNFNLSSNSYQLTVTDNQNCTYPVSCKFAQKSPAGCHESRTRFACSGK